MATHMKYGDYEFRPVPLLDISKNPIKLGNDYNGLGNEYQVVLDGDILLTNGNITSGTHQVFTEVNELKDAFAQDGKLFVAYCSGVGGTEEKLFVSGYPIVDDVSINVESDNYTRRAGFSITLKMPSLSGVFDGLNTGNGYIGLQSNTGIFLSDFSESYDASIRDDYFPAITHWTQGSCNNKEEYPVVLDINRKVSAKVRPVYSGGELVFNLESGVQFINDYLNTNTQFDYTGIVGITSTALPRYNLKREVSVNKFDWAIDATESYVAINYDANTYAPNTGAIETYTVDVSRSDYISTVTVQGEIQGLALTSFDGGPIAETSENREGFISTQSAYSNARAFLTGINDLTFCRASEVFAENSGFLYGDSTCRASPLTLINKVSNSTIGVNPVNGLITYSISYNNSLQNCFSVNPCILSSNATITDNLATDVFASQTIIGRGALGPILQDINASTARVKQLNVELVVPPSTGCDTLIAITGDIPLTEVDSLISLISGDLVTNYDQVFVSTNTQNWNFTQGRYTRTVAWTYNDCEN
ncbi:MAG: hypothetical protein HWN81_04400 [Candidatus Lokiarchaeota archaeon]|nr:hypothetical protein [Candidatus Lokiarchaeota archaeon]